MIPRRWNPLLLAALALATAALLLATLYLIVRPCRTRAPDATLPLPAGFDAPPQVRVRLAHLPENPLLEITGPYLIRPLQPKNPSPPLTLPRLKPVRLRLRKGVPCLGARALPHPAVEIQPENSSVLKLDGQPYPGRLRLLVVRGRLAVVNVLDLETYLAGVVGAEMPANWPEEALKAQAVAARTYALYAVRKHPHSPWHLVATVQDQVYRGGPPPPGIRRLVRATRGHLLLHQGRIFPAFYHSTCGGHTDSPRNAVNFTGLDFLQPVPCPYCRDSKFHTWTARLTPRELAARLRHAHHKVPAPVTAVTVVTSDDRPGRFARVAWPGGRLTLPMADFRRAADPAALRNGRFQCRLHEGTLLFTGRGFGHGAGMCQYGARGLARTGAVYTDILKHYYPNTAVRKLY